MYISIHQEIFNLDGLRAILRNKSMAQTGADCFEIHFVYQVGETQKAYFVDEYHRDRCVRFISILVGAVDVTERDWSDYTVVEGPVGVSEIPSCEYIVAPSRPAWRFLQELYRSLPPLLNDG